MTAADLNAMIRARHPSPAWIVLHEVANGTGAQAKRRADAVAIGIWPSHGFEIHGFEVKISRSDVRRELGEPWKADAVGKFCDRWWLVISDESIIDNVALPPAWGVLTPKRGSLRAVKKAPKLKAEPINRSFFASLTRDVIENWVPKHEHLALKETAQEAARQEFEQKRKYASENAAAELADLKLLVKQFEEASGVSINRWNAGRVGEAVQRVLDIRNELGHESIDRQIKTLERSSEHLEEVVRRERKAIEVLRGLCTSD